LSEPTLGTAIYFAMFYSAFVSGMWWWFMAPVGAIVLLFVSLFLISVGLDELANPRTRRTA
jgi:peptide/nickel transport system permease protein